MTNFRHMLRDRRGATAIEYGLIAALIAVAAVGAMSGLGDQISKTFNNSSTTMSKGLFRFARRMRQVAGSKFKSGGWHEPSAPYFDQNVISFTFCPARTLASAGIAFSTRNRSTCIVG